MLISHVWVKSAKATTAGFNTAKHLIYFRLSGGFRFPTAFNANTAEEFSAWGAGPSVEGVDWGMGQHLQKDD